MSTSTLTERYVHEVVRQLPTDQRDDVAEELRATIADAVEGRGGDDPADTERQVLTEMGDPIRLAARYGDRRLSLIGPELYPAYLRLMTVLLCGLLPLVVVGLLLVDLVDGVGLGPALGGALLALFLVGGQLIAWVTVVFALVERSRQRRGGAAGQDRWDPDDLPPHREPPREQRGRTFWASASVALHALLVCGIVWQHVAEPYHADGERVPLLAPDLWSGWMWPLLGGLAGILVTQLVRVATGSWTTRLLLWYTVAQAAVALPLAYLLAQQRFVNEVFLHHVNGEGWTTPDSFWTGAAVVVLLWSTVEVLDRFREPRR